MTSIAPGTHSPTAVDAMVNMSSKDGTVKGGDEKNDEKKPQDNEEKQETFDLSILADAAAKSPVRAVPPEEPRSAPAAIPLPLSEGEKDKKALGSKRPAGLQKKPAAKKARNLPASKSTSKTATELKAAPQKRSSRARKLPSKLKQTASSSSGAMSAAAILVQVATGAAPPKKKKAKKKSADNGGVGGDGDIRGITMKRPGKWVSHYY